MGPGIPIIITFLPITIRGIPGPGIIITITIDVIRKVCSLIFAIMLFITGEVPVPDRMMIQQVYAGIITSVIIENPDLIQINQDLLIMHRASILGHTTVITISLGEFLLISGAWFTLVITGVLLI
jgi:hypothetical protein